MAKEKNVAEIANDLMFNSLESNQVANVAEIAAEIGNDLMIEGLESNQVLDLSGVDYSNREFLENNVPDFDPDFTSAKYDPEREPKVQAGLSLIGELMAEKINPLVLLLAKWWEVKPARAAIKNMIDDEAKKASVPEDIYLQINLRENVDKLAQIQNAVDRMRYSITYFKPRAGIGSKEQYKQLRIDGDLYSVSLIKLNELKEQFGEDKESIKNALKVVSFKVDIEEYL